MARTQLEKMVFENFGQLNVREMAGITCTLLFLDEFRRGTFRAKELPVLGELIEYTLGDIEVETEGVEEPGPEI